MHAGTAVSTARHPWTLFAAILLLLAMGATACNRSSTSAPAAAPATATVAPAASPPVNPSPTSRSSHDLSADEARGGHTLARHVGKTDDELRARLRREPDISSASTYPDRATAEAVVGEALSSAPKSFDAWRRRSGRRPNFVLHFGADHVIGRCMARGRTAATPCEHALIVVRWDER